MDRRPDFLGGLFTPVLGSAPGPRISRLTRLLIIQERAALRADLERYAALPDLTRLVLSHDKVSHGADAARTLHRALEFL